MARLLLTLLATLFFLPLETVCAGTLSHHKFESSTLGRDYPFNIYLPDGYANSENSYPVLYLLHGSNGNENDWSIKGNVVETTDRLIANKTIIPAIIVMPGSESWWVDGYNEKAETAFLEDLIPYVEANWRVVPQRQGRFLAGLSAGGYASVNFVLKHPKLFAAAAALSPASYFPYPPATSSAMSHPTFTRSDGSFDEALWQTLNYTQYITTYKAQEFVVPLYINSGDHDEFDITYHAAVLYQSLREHQPEHIEFRVVDGGHEWAVWARTLPEAMIYLFSFANNPVPDNSR